MQRGSGDTSDSMAMPLCGNNKSQSRRYRPLNKALRRTFALLISRVKAYGEKWKLWYNKQRMQAHARIIAAKYRQLALIDQDEEGRYTVADALIKAYEEAKD